MTPSDPHRITRHAELAALFGPVGEASLRKEVDHLHPVYQRWIAAAPFFALASVGPGGLDVSPRGDPAPQVRIEDEHTLSWPERRGNNRIDSLRNLIDDPRVALLFLIPGVNETLRVNGRASLHTDPALCASFAMDGKAPVCVVRVAVDTVFFQCGRAMLRSALWSAQGQAPAGVPTAGEILGTLTRSEIDGVAYDQELPGRLRSSLY